MTARDGHCRDLLEQLSRYIDGELREVDRRTVTLHLEHCPSCEELVDSLRQTVAVCRDAGRRRLPRDVRARARARIDSLLSGAPAAGRRSAKARG
jgi:anti-sigma factor RsiW